MSSNVDWLSLRDFNVGDLFARVVPAPGHGEHAMRAEVLLSAFSSDVVTGTSEVDLIVKGKKPIARLVQRAVDRSWSRRFVAFRVAQ